MEADSKDPLMRKWALTNIDSEVVSNRVVLIHETTRRKRSNSQIASKFVQHLSLAIFEPVVSKICRHLDFVPNATGAIISPCFRLNFFAELEQSPQSSPPPYIWLSFSLKSFWIFFQNHIEVLARGCIQNWDILRLLQVFPPNDLDDACLSGTQDRSSISTLLQFSFKLLRPLFHESFYSYNFFQRTAWAKSVMQLKESPGNFGRFWLFLLSCSFLCINNDVHEHHINALGNYNTQARLDGPQTR